MGLDAESIGGAHAFRQGQHCVLPKMAESMTEEDDRVEDAKGDWRPR
jgi:hypothetical protein